MQKTKKQFKVVMIGTGDPGRPPVLSGFLKTYIDSIETLKNKVHTELMVITEYDEIKKIINSGYDMFVFSPHEDWDNNEMFEICKKIKSSFPNTYIVICAENPRNRIRLEEILSSANVDFVIHGESEIVLGELINSIVNNTPLLKDVRGIINLMDGKIRYHKPMPPIKNLDDLPSPYLNKTFNLKTYKSLELIVSRGCKYNCKYCTINEGGARFFSPERIKKELKTIIVEAPALQEISIMGFDMFADPLWSESLLKLFRYTAEKYKIRFTFDVNINSLNNVKLLKLINTPYFHMEIGVQSINTTTLATAGRASDINTIKNNINLLKKYAPYTNCYISIIRGLPQDTLKDYQNTLDWAISTGYHLIVNHLRVMPETTFDKMATKYKIKVSEKYPYFVISTQNMTETEIKKAILLTDQAGFILNLTNHNETFKKRFYALAHRQQMRKTFPYLKLALGFYKHLSETDTFSKVINQYILNRKNQKSSDWAEDFIETENINEAHLLKEFERYEGKMTIKKELVSV